MCGLARPLLLQVYAPLDKSQFHRTFYVFACMNPSCSTQSKGWICVRVQHLDKVYDRNTAATKKKAKPKVNKNRSNWCDGADDWGGDDTIDDDYISNSQQLPQIDDNLNEQNGNDVTFVATANDNRMGSDDDDDSNSADDPIPSFGHLHVIDDKNANCGAQGGGAAALLNSPSASAEIEGEESEMVTVDAPVAPERDLIAMLKKSRAIPADVNELVLQSYFITVDEEQCQDTGTVNVSLDEHVRDLMQKYQNDEKSECFMRLLVQLRLICR